jgi:hypothetical protein
MVLFQSVGKCHPRTSLISCSPMIDRLARKEPDGCAAITGTPHDGKS